MKIPFQMRQVKQELTKPIGPTLKVWVVLFVAPPNNLKY